jgi:hypothetical protein
MNQDNGGFILTRIPWVEIMKRYIHLHPQGGDTETTEVEIHIPESPGWR